MITQQDRNKAQKGIIVCWFIWFALFISLGIYLGIAYMVVEQIEISPMPADTYNTLKYALMGVGVVILIITPFIRRAIRITGGQTAQTGSPPGAEKPDIETVLQKYSAAVIVSLSSSEAIGIFGLVLFFLGKDFQTLHIFLIVSAAAMIINRPKMNEIEQAFE